MVWYLDTNVCIDFLRGEHTALLEHFQQMLAQQIKVPAVVKMELLYGAERSKNPAREQRIVNAFLAPYEIIPFDDTCTAVCASIRHQLEAAGQHIGPWDNLIAATALAHQATLVTNNVKEFSRIPGLQIENWVEVDLQ
jgi:tRNA(fMet)-specific endonuclease VapC